jgi:hypothetical protein
MAGRGLLTETAIDLRGKHRETWSSACFLGRFARDSPLEEDGFEPSVPLSVLTVSRPPLVAEDIPDVDLSVHRENVR